MPRRPRPASPRGSVPRWSARCAGRGPGPSPARRSAPRRPAPVEAEAAPRVPGRPPRPAGRRRRPGRTARRAGPGAYRRTGSSALRTAPDRRHSPTRARRPAARSAELRVGRSGVPAAGSAVRAGSAARAQAARRGPASVLTVTPSSSWVTSRTAVPQRTVTPSSARCSRRTCSVRHCGIISVRAYGESGVGSAPGCASKSDASGSPSAPALHRRSGMRNRPSDTMRSASPSRSSSSSVRGCTPLPREPGNGPDAASSTSTRTPRRASSHAVIRPVGPAPTTITSVVMTRP